MRAVAHGGRELLHGIKDLHFPPDLDADVKKRSKKATDLIRVVKGCSDIIGIRQKFGCDLMVLRPGGFI